MDLIELCEKEPSLEKLMDFFNNQNLSDYVVVYLRLLTSGYLQREHGFFQHFIEGGRSVKEFCQQVGARVSQLFLQPSFLLLPASCFSHRQPPSLSLFQGGGANVERKRPHSHHRLSPGPKRLHPGGVHGQRRGWDSQSPRLPRRRRPPHLPPLQTRPL